MFYQSRWYDPASGRFSQADTIVPGGVQGLDRFAYVNNSPLNYVDPSGHFGQCHDGQSGYQCKMTLINAWQASQKGPENLPIPSAPTHGRCEEIGAGGICKERPYEWLWRWDRQKAIEKAIEWYGLELPEGVSTDIIYDPTLKDEEGNTPPEIINNVVKIRIGPKAFSRSFGWLGSSIAHELCHGRQLAGWSCFKSDKTESYRQRDPKTFYSLSQGGYLMEVEAYNLELSMASYFGLDADDINDLEISLADKISYLNEDNQLLALSHNYDCTGSNCYKGLKAPNP